MTAIDRLRGEIKLTSPKGKEFSGKWIGDPRSMQKKLGQFTFPKVQGTKTQDLEVTGTTYPLTIYFDGPDNDQTAEEFFEALKQKGKWQVIHPVFGSLDLQLVDVTDNVQPIESISYRLFNTNWIESLPEGAEVSKPQQKGEIESQVETANEVAADQFVGRTFMDFFSEAGAMATAVNKVISAFRKNIRIATNFNIIPAQVEGLNNSIQGLISDFPIDTESLATQLQQLVQVTVLGQDNVIDANDSYVNFAGAMQDIAPTVASKEGVNTISVQELMLSATLGAVALSSSALPGITTRSQAVQTAEGVIDYFNAMTDNLDVTQDLFKDVPIEFQYYSQSQSYADNLVLTAQSAQYLLISAVDLKVERRFILQEDRNILDICAAEYEDITDETLDFFIDTNNLKSDEIRVLPSLKEVAVFT